MQRRLHLRPGHCLPACQLIDRQAEGVSRELERDGAGGIALRPRLQVHQHRVVLATVSRRVDIDDHPAGHGGRSRELPQDEPITRDARQGRVDVQLDETLRAGFQAVAVEQQDFCRDLGCPLVKEEASPVANCAWRSLEDAHAGIEATAHAKRARTRQQPAARNLPAVDAREVDGRAAPGTRLCDRSVVLLQTTNPDPALTGEQRQLVTELEHAADQRSGDDRPETWHGERAIDPDPGPALIRTRGRLRELIVERLHESLEPLAGDARDRHDRGVRQRLAVQRSSNVSHDQLEPVGLDQIALGERDHAMPDREQVHDGEVLVRLRHRPLVGRDDEEHGIDAVYTGKHVLEEALMARDIDDPHVASAGEVEEGEAEVNRHPPALLLLEPIRIDAGQGLHQP
jgi:hypothetical protein